MRHAYQAGLVLNLVMTQSLAAGAASIQTIALTGQQAPGLPTGVAFDSLYHPVINASGDIVFSAELIGAGVDASNDSGLWSGSISSIDPVAREGDHAPGTSDDVVFGSFRENVPSFSDAGHLAFVTEWLSPEPRGPNEIRNGIWLVGKNSFDLLAQTGEQAVGAPTGVKLLWLGSPQVNASGQVLFNGTADGTGVESVYRSGLWKGDSSTISAVALTGQQAVGLPTGVEFGDFRQLSLNASGEISFHSYLLGDEVEGYAHEGVWTGSENSLSLVVHRGADAPGFPEEIEFGGVHPRSQLDKAGQRVSWVQLVNRETKSPYWTALALASPDSVEFIVGEGEQAPGTSEGVEFATLSSNSLNSAGQFAFWSSLNGASVDDTNDSGIWIGDLDSIELIARKGDRPPGVPTEFSYGAFRSAIRNETGQTAFWAQLADDDGRRIQEYGIWAQDRGGIVRLIARTGDLIEVAPADTRTIDGLQFFSSGPGDNGIPTATGLNDRGQVAFWASFTDGSQGIFVSNRVAVPEPGALLLAASFFAAVSVRRLWHRRIERNE